jgi:hypothetical protein
MTKITAITCPCLRNGEKTEGETGKNIPMMIAAAKRGDSKVSAAFSNGLQDVRAVLERLRMQQANMTPAERRAQARWSLNLYFSDEPVNPTREIFPHRGKTSCRLASVFQGILSGHACLALAGPAPRWHVHCIMSNCSPVI